MRTPHAGLGLVALVAVSACATAPASGPGAPTTAGVSGTPTPRPGHPVPIPARFPTGRLILAPVTRDGRTVTFVGDTGGGLYLYAAAAKRLGLRVGTTTVGGATARLARLPDWRPGAWIPPPSGPLGDRVLVHAHPPGYPPDGVDGGLGQAWFGGRVWTLDYPARRLWLRAAGDLPPHAAADVVPLGFHPGIAFPRITVTIDGAPVDLLLDTGALIWPTADAVGVLGAGPPVRAVSFIDRRVFARWHARHPGWRVVEHADRTGHGAPMILVPAVTVAGHTVGPVWFVVRPDKSYRTWMSQWMDRPVDGSLGGNVLRHFQVTLDFPGKRAVFVPGR